MVGYPRPVFIQRNHDFHLYFFEWDLFAIYVQLLLITTAFVPTHLSSSFMAAPTPSLSLLHSISPQIFSVSISASHWALTLFPSHKTHFNSSFLLAFFSKFVALESEQNGVQEWGEARFGVAVLMLQLCSYFFSVRIYTFFFLNLYFAGFACFWMICWLSCFI